MATLKPLYGSNNQAITITFTSLATNGQRASAAVDNSSNLYRDVLVQVVAKNGGSGASAASVINIYAYGTADGGSHYSDGVGGTNAGVTLTSPPNMVLIGWLAMPANSTQYVSAPFNVAMAFGGVLPDHWGIVIENKTGTTLDASVGSAWYQGVNDQAV